jgi:hypothetical protein
MDHGNFTPGLTCAGILTARVGTAKPPLVTSSVSSNSTAKARLALHQTAPRLPPTSYPTLTFRAARKAASALWDWRGMRRVGCT